MNKKNKLDIGIISDKWLSVSTLDVYCPPPSIPTLVLARAHSAPSDVWGKCDIIDVKYTTRKIML